MEPRGVEICPFPLLLLLAFTTACATVQAVIPSLAAACNIQLVYVCYYLLVRSKVNLRCFCFREYELDSSKVLEQLSEEDQEKSISLLKRNLSRWGNLKMFSLVQKVADGIDFVDFLTNNCCQTYLDRTWFKTSIRDLPNIKVIVQFTL